MKRFSIEDLWKIRRPAGITLARDGMRAAVHFPDENHWILKPQNSRLWYREFFAWLKRFHLAGPRAARS